MTKADFINAFNIAVEKEIEEDMTRLPTETIIFSQKFDSKMSRLIKKQKSNYWHYVNSVGKKIAIIAITAGVLFAGSMSVEAIRTPVLNKLTEIFDKFIQYTYTYFDSNIEFKVSEPKYLPNGFFEKQISRNDSGNEIEYTNSENETIVFIQVPVNGTVISNDNEFVDKQNINVDGNEVTLLISKNYIEAYWIQENYFMNITAYYDIEVSELIKMITSVSQV